MTKGSLFKRALIFTALAASLWAYHHHRAVRERERLELWMSYLHGPLEACLSAFGTTDTAWQLGSGRKEALSRAAAELQGAWQQAEAWQSKAKQDPFFSDMHDVAHGHQELAHHAARWAGMSAAQAPQAQAFEKAFRKALAERLRLQRDRWIRGPGLRRADLLEGNALISTLAEGTDL